MANRSRVYVVTPLNSEYTLFNENPWIKTHVNETRILNERKGYTNLFDTSTNIVFKTYHLLLLIICKSLPINNIQIHKSQSSELSFTDNKMFWKKCSTIRITGWKVIFILLVNELSNYRIRIINYQILLSIVRGYIFYVSILSHFLLIANLKKQITSL